MTPLEFILKWRRPRFGERQGAQSFFNDLCAAVGHPAPAEYANPDIFTFEKYNNGGSADVYYEDHFAWEFKSRDAYLDDGMNQLLRYQIHLKTPPLLIVSSFRTIRIQTNFPGMETVRHEFPVSELDAPENLIKLHNAFHAPNEFRTDRTPENVTQETADILREIVIDMELRHDDPEKLARYLNRIIFCLYAESAGLLNEQAFTQTAARHYRNPARFDHAVRNLFTQMTNGGLFGFVNIGWFNGNLFDNADTIELSPGALQRLLEATGKNWRSIEPSIFGTLFERALNASKRSQLGAHYTGADDIALVVDPVIMQPLRREWQTAKCEIDQLITTAKDADAAQKRLESFRRRLSAVTVLDPACGSGNFLYVALRSLLDLEKEIIDYAAGKGWHGLHPQVKPDQMHGLEIDPYAAELARTALWIGYIQWHQSNGFAYNRQPILSPLNTIRQTDAILADGNTENPQETKWPAAEFIIGNPPFLGSLPFRRELGDAYANAVYGLYGGRIPNASDFCCYWFEKARAQIENGQTRRAGLLATQAIRFQNNRRVLARIQETGNIFSAISDKDWILDGANVHISIICFDDGAETIRALDGRPVDIIHTDLTAGADLTQARKLPENANISFAGDKKHGDFQIDQATAAEMLNRYNPNGKPNSDVVKPWLIGHDVNQKPGNRWIIDFGVAMPESEAAMYEAPFEYVRRNVKPKRDKHRDPRLRRYWWLHGAPRIAMRQALTGLPRYIVSSQVSKHRMFSWVDGHILPDSTLIVFARDDDYFFGLLHSRIHAVWAAALGTQRRESVSGKRYIISTCFETFPFPNPTKEQQTAIAAAALELHTMRANALRDPQRTLTALYNNPPKWLTNAHAALDAAVAAAYNLPPNLDDAAILSHLLTLNQQRSP